MVEAIERLAGDPLLTLGPVVGWRTWEVTPRLPSETGPPVVLRGQRGMAWPGPRHHARCVDGATRSFLLARGRADAPRTEHRGAVPAVTCRCGIYAHKPGQGERVGLPAAPRIRGWVELSGTVVEGSRGYRAEQATIVGPLELEVPCAGQPLGSGGCDAPVVAVARTNVHSYRGMCADEAHRRTTGGTTVAVEAWRVAVSRALTDRYGVGVLTFT